MSVKTIVSFLELAISPLKAKLDRPFSKKGYFCSSSTTTEDLSISRNLRQHLNNRKSYQGSCDKTINVIEI